MMLWLAAALFIGGVFSLRIDRSVASYLRARLDTPPLQFAWKITNLAKGLPWIIVAVFFYLVVQGTMAARGETDFLHMVSNFSLALLASFIVGSAALHTIKIFLGRRRPRDDYEHGLYGFRFFTWELQFDSFPSGHAMTIFCVAVVLSAVAPWLAPLWLTLAAGLAMTRALMTAHFISDVLIGGAIGILATRETLLLGFPQLVPAWF